MHGKGAHEDESKRPAAFDELVAALDACSALPDSSQIAPGIAQRRLLATDLYRRSDAECEQALQELLRTELEISRRVMATLSSCKERPAVLAKYLPGLVSELEQAVPDDPRLRRPLEYALHALRELGAGQQ